MLPDGADQGRATAHPVQDPGGVLAQLAEAGWAEIRQFVLFPVEPLALDRIQLRGVAGREFDPDPPALLSNEIPHRAAAVRCEPIPDGTTLYGMGGYQGSVQLANGLVYGGAGGIIDPSTTPPSQIATLPLFDFYGSGSTGFFVADVPMFLIPPRARISSFSRTQPGVWLMDWFGTI